MDAVFGTHNVRTLHLDGDAIVEVLRDQIASAPTTVMIPAIVTAGLLRAESMREVLADLATHPRAAVRDASVEALRLLDGADIVEDEVPPETEQPHLIPEFPSERCFHGPKDTTLVLIPSSRNWADDARTVITVHPDGTQDVLPGGRDALAFTQAQIMGLVDLPEQQRAAMGEVVVFDSATGTVTKSRLRHEDSEDEE